MMDTQSRQNPYNDDHGGGYGGGMRGGYNDRGNSYNDRGGGGYNDFGGQRGGRGGGGPRPSRQEAHRRFKESVSGHRTGLPKKLLDLFTPRPPLPFMAPITKKKPKLPYSGVSQYLQHFAEPGDEQYEPPRPEGATTGKRVFRNQELALQARIDIESRAEKKVRLREQKMEKAKTDVEEGLKTWDPKKDAKIEGDPYKTLFVGRISYDVTERNLKREFEEFGPIKRIRLVHDTKTGKPRGYAFIEFDSKRDMNEAWNMAEGMKIEGRRITVDVEKGRTVDGWRPRRLGGGLGGQSRMAREPGSSERDAGFRGEGLPEREHRPERERERRDVDRGGDRDRFRERERDRGDREFRGGREHREEKDQRRDRDRERGPRSHREREPRREDRDRERGRGREWEGERRDRRRHASRERGEERDQKRPRHLEDGELEHHEHRRRETRD
ncbi:hypothetical protein BSKO_03598 [Bryopsis sp. KO-2023]|nr:hypothetical protein BSKO_03598 [Bryopsis sp. KO-2023]